MASPSRPSQKPAHPHNGVNQLRIIGGEWRSRRLRFPDVPGLRPTPDRVRETLFNWLAPYVAEAKVLDPFAGSGALFLEALSRGAAMGKALDASNLAVANLREHLGTLRCSVGQVQTADAMRYLETQ
ncbi:16S rRNA (guanine(966)-N(2))-methyltransferase RsmD, partial [Pseudomonas sp. MWU13-2625]